MSRTAVVRVLIAGTLVLALVAGGWWLTHPQQVEGGHFVVGTDRGVVGATMWMPLLERDTAGPRELDITGIETQWGSDPAAATVDYRICVVHPGDVRGFIIGGKDRDLETYCSSTRPAIGSTLHLRADPAEVLILGVTPTRAGRSSITGHRVDYRVGWQRGHMVLDVGTKVRAKGST